MKKIFYLLLATPIIFLTSCSSGGDSTPTPSNESLLPGNWMAIEVRMDAEYYALDGNANHLTLLDTSIVWDAADMILNMGSIGGFEINENGTYTSYESDGIDIWEDTTGVWSATSTTLTVDGEDYGTYSVSADNLTIYMDDILMTEIEDGVFMDITNLEQKYANVDGFGIISDPQTKKKGPGIEQFFSKKFW